MSKTVARWSLDPGDGIFGRYVVIDLGNSLYEILLTTDDAPEKSIGAFRVAGGKVIWWRCEVPKEFCEILADFVRDGNLKSIL